MHPHSNSNKTIYKIPLGQAEPVETKGQLMKAINLKHSFH